tara:strand:+ start:718 stop:1164 length:447 start_codon:yes stop_codon:yes gene_type:complete
MATTVKNSDLPASGFTRTNTKLHQWAKHLVLKARSMFGGDEIFAAVWAYREQGYDHLSCDLFNKDKSKSLPVTICSCGEYYFQDVKGGTAEADVHDMPEAIHLAGIITQALNAIVKVGLGKNEVNPEALAAPMREGQTNVPIDLFETE